MPMVTAPYEQVCGILTAVCESNPQIVPELTADTRRYLNREYPHNHCYRVAFGRLWPNRQLRRRAKRIHDLYPQELESLLDLSVSKGYFALKAGMATDRPRVLGIDVNETAVALTEAVAEHFALGNVRAETLRLHELVANLGEYGGPFQTVLMINMYQYLYCGGVTEPDYYQSHEEIFQMLREVCSHTLVFSNVVSPERFPPWMERRAKALNRLEGYSEPAIRAAAEPYFHIQEHGILGRRPLWRMTVR